MIDPSQLLEVMKTLPIKPVADTFVRSVDAAAVYGPRCDAEGRRSLVWPTFLFFGDRANRFNTTGCRVEYLAEGVKGVVSEITQQPFDLTRAPLGARIEFWVMVKAPAMLDLTNPEVQGALHTSFDELTAPWRPISAAGGIAPTQALGLAAMRCGRFQGLLYQGAPLWSVHQRSVCVALFGERLDGAEAYAELFDPTKFWGPQRVPPLGRLPMPAPPPV